MRILLLVLTLFAPLLSFGETPYLQVGEAKAKKPAVALLSPIANPNLSAEVALIQKTIQTDLEFTDQFRIAPESGFPQTSIVTPSEVHAADWVKAGADFLAWGTYTRSETQLVYELHFTHLGNANEILGKRYLSAPDEARTLAHAIANDLVEAITGKKGLFLTRIAFVCDKSGKKEIYSMTFDGQDVRQVTRLKSLTMAPAWSPDGTRMAFSVYNRHSDNTKNLDLFEYDFSTSSLRILSNRKGINSGANYFPDGTKIVYTLSSGGNPDLYTLNLKTLEVSQLTRSLGFDVDPALSPDGQTLAFVSSRPGKPMIYTAPLKSPQDARRLTYAGSYNATPSWSPDGKKLVFAGWIDQHFDLFTITPDGGKIERLTKNEGNNEDPSFSPDGNFIAFSSSRSGGKNIFVMNAEGGNIRRLTFGMGSCVAPKWSPYLK